MPLIESKDVIWSFMHCKMICLVSYIV